jgi:hypothetical protein
MRFLSSCLIVGANGGRSGDCPHPALSLRKGCLLEPRRVWREKLLERTVKISQAQSNHSKPDRETEVNEVNEEDKVTLSPPGGEISFRRHCCLVGLLCKNCAGPLGTARFSCISGPIRAGRSNPVRLSQSESNLGLATNKSGKDAFRKAKPGRRTQGTKGTKGTASRRIKPNQTKSNRGGGEVGQWPAVQPGQSQSKPVKPSHVLS